MLFSELADKSLAYRKARASSESGVAATSGVSVLALKRPARRQETWTWVADLDQFP
jgi:hypothetical protein